MRIIDKNTDYYDYLQNSEDTIVFDRRGSYLLTKDKFCKALTSLHHYQWGKHKKINDCEYYNYILLQCGATYWLILEHTTKYDENYYPTDYELELLSTWKNYNKKRRVLQLDDIQFKYGTLIKQKEKQTYHDFIVSNVNRMVDAVDTYNYKVRNMNGDKVWKSHKDTYITEERTLPILTACGIADIIDPVDIFTALEEHFSLLKTESERIDPIGATNNDKIEMHGFDTKLSFRGNPK